MWWLAAVLSIALIGWGFLSSQRILYPKRRFLPPSDPLLRYTTQVLRAPDGSAFDVWRLSPPSPRAHLVMCHGYYANRYQILGIAQGLCARGYDALLLELRGHGSRPGPCTLGIREAQDVGTVLAWVRSQDGDRPLPIGAFGLSMGAAVACQAAAAFTQITAIVADSVYASFFHVVTINIRRLYRLPPVPFAWAAWWALQIRLGQCLGRVDPVTLAPRLRQALFAIQSGADHHVRPQESARFFERWGGPKERWVASDVPHVGMYKRNPEQYCNRVAAFLDRALG